MAFARADRESWIAAVDGLAIKDGGDGAESQSIALYRACSEWGWSEGVSKVRPFLPHSLWASSFLLATFRESGHYGIWRLRVSLFWYTY